MTQICEFTFEQTNGDQLCYIEKKKYFPLTYLYGKENYSMASVVTRFANLEFVHFLLRNWITLYITTV